MTTTFLLVKVNDCCDGGLVDELTWCLASTAHGRYTPRPCGQQPSRSRDRHAQPYSRPVSSVSWSVCAALRLTLSPALGPFVLLVVVFCLVRISLRKPLTYDSPKLQYPPMDLGRGPAPWSPSDSPRSSRSGLRRHPMPRPRLSAWPAGRGAQLCGHALLVREAPFWVSLGHLGGGLVHPFWFFVDLPPR